MIGIRISIGSGIGISIGISIGIGIHISIGIGISIAIAFVIAILTFVSRKRNPNDATLYWIDTTITFLSEARILGSYSSRVEVPE